MLVRFRPKAHLVVGARCLRMCDHELVAKRAKQVRAACDAAYAVRIGDVRHHLINVIESPETPSP